MNATVKAERDEARAVCREIKVLAEGLHRHGPAGMSRRTASAILAALSRVLPGIEVPPFIEPTATDCGQYADKLLAPAPTSTPDDTPKPLQNQGFGMVSPSGFEPETL